MTTVGPEGAPAPEMPRLLTEEELRTEAQGRGLRQKFFRGEPLIGAIEGLPKNEVWNVGEALDDVSLAMAQIMGMKGSIYGMGRPDMYAGQALTGVMNQMEISISVMADGGIRNSADLLNNNERQVDELRSNLFAAMAEKELHGLDRAQVAGGIWEDDEDTQTSRFVPRADQAVKERWSGKMAQLNMRVDDVKNKMRGVGSDEKSANANDLFTLIGIDPKRIAEYDAKPAPEKAAIIESRREVQYWGEAEARGLNTLIEYFGQVTKAISDIDSSQELLTRQWNDKPGNTELMGILRSPTMDKAVTAVWNVLLDSDVVDVTYAIENMNAKFKDSKGNDLIRTVPVRVPRVIEKAYLKADLTDAARERKLVKSAYTEGQNPDERKRWLSDLRDVVAARLKDNGIEKANEWADQALPVALAFYEISLLGSRHGYRYDSHGKPIMVPSIKKEPVLDRAGQKTILFGGRSGGRTGSRSSARGTGKA